MPAWVSCDNEVCRKTVGIDDAVRAAGNRWLCRPCNAAQQAAGETSPGESRVIRKMVFADGVASYFTDDSDLAPVPTAHHLFAAESHGKPRAAGWRAVEQQHIVDNPTCIGCGGRRYLQVHHVQPFHVDPALELVPSNLRTLCMDPNRLCHFRLGHSFLWAAWNPHVDGDATQQLSRIKHRKSA